MRTEAEVIKNWDQVATPLLSICCVTYNHAEFIEHALKGFLMQETNFPFEVLVHDDASTDGTADIIRRYEKEFPKIIKPIYQSENQYSKLGGAIQQFNIYRAKGKYMAFCDGDDSWVNSTRLQRQVDFLEANKDYMLTTGGYRSNNHGRINEVIKLGNPVYINETDAGFTYELSIGLDWVNHPLTVVFRNDSKMFEKIAQYKRIWDFHLFYHLLKEGKGYYFKEVFGVYNYHKGGVYGLRSTSEKSFFRYHNYKELYEVNQDEYMRWMYSGELLWLINRILYKKIDKPEVGLGQLIKQAWEVSKKPKDKLKLLRTFIPMRLRRLFGVDKKTDFIRPQAS